MTKVFISYSRPNENSALRLHADLKAQGYSPWIDKEKLLPGQRWRDEIISAIRQSDFAIVLFSSEAVGRDGFYQREIRTCLDMLQDKAASKVWLLPVRLDECTL